MIIQNQGISDSKTVKECMLKVVTALFKRNKGIIYTFQNISLSVRYNTRT